jgi:hypothetical protein
MKQHTTPVGCSAYFNALCEIAQACDQSGLRLTIYIIE